MANYASHQVKFELEHTGKGIAKSEIKGLTSAKFSVDTNKEEWTDFGNKGWAANLVTGKTLTIGLEAKIDLEDSLTKKLIELAFGSGSADHNGWTLTVTLPKSKDTVTTAATISLNGSLGISDVLTGESTDVGSISMEFSQSGAPIFTEEVATK